MQTFIFILMSGIGWMLDLSFLYFLVQQQWPTFFANIISSMVAVSFVYWMSRVFIFSSRQITRRTSIGFFAYIIYSIICIVIFSYLISVIGSWVQELDVLGITALLSYPSIVLLVKILITPLSLFINYLFNKKLSCWF